MRYRVNASLLFLAICLVFSSLVQTASADKGIPEIAAVYILSQTDTSNVKDKDLLEVYREAEATLIYQVKDGLVSRRIKVNIAESERDIAADPSRYVVLVRIDNIELGGKRPFGRTAKVKVSHTLQNKDRFDMLKRSHEETSVQKWQNCVKKISEQLVEDVSTDIAKKAVPVKVESRQDKPAQAPAGSASEARLRELESLKAKGLITEKEYKAKRKAIVEGL